MKQPRWSIPQHPVRSATAAETPVAADTKDENTQGDKIIKLKKVKPTPAKKQEK